LRRIESSFNQTGWILDIGKNAFFGEGSIVVAGTRRRKQLLMFQVQRFPNRIGPIGVDFDPIIREL
jgi:hypothetical protein